MNFMNAFGFSKASASKKKHRGANRKRAVTRKVRFESLERRELFTTSPFYIKNHTPFDASEIHLAMFSKDYETTPNNYYFDQNGNAILTNTVGSGNAIPTFTLGNLTLDATQNAYVLNLPQEIGVGNTGIQSARLYFGMGPNGVGNPLGNMTVAADGSVNAPIMGNNFFDYVELSLNSSGNTTGNQTDLNIDTSQVDAMGFPIKVQVESTENPSDVGIELSRQEVINQYTLFTAGTPFAQSLWSVDPTTNQPYRITNPSDVLSNIALQTNSIEVQTTLQGNIGISDTTITVYDALPFPTPVSGTPSTYFDIVVQDPVAGDETMTVTGVSFTNGNYVWNVTRNNPIAHTVPQSPNPPIMIVPVAPSISATQTKITIDGNSGFPTTYPFVMQIGNGTSLEIVNVQSGVVNNDGTVTYTVERGQGINGALTHNNNDVVHASDVTGNPLNIHFNEAIDDLFAQYHFGNGTAPGNSTLLLQLTGSDSNTYGGYVTTDGSGCTVFRFNNLTDTSDLTNYDVYYPFFKDNELFWTGYTPEFAIGDVPADLLAANPQWYSPSLMVFACNGVFADSATRAGLSADQQKILGNLENQIVSSLNRGVSTLAPSDWDDPAMYYNAGAYNVYAQFFHDNAITINNQAYAFAFDDQQGQASDISVAKFSSATITLGSWTTAHVQNGDLHITGTSGNDNISVTDLGKKKGIQVMVNGKVEGVFKNFTGTIFADGVTGNDVISIASSIKLATSLRGGDGDDILISGAGSSILNGGLGKNILIGRKGRDIVVDDGGDDKAIMSKAASYWSTVNSALSPLTKNKKFSLVTFNLLKKLIK